MSVRPPLETAFLQDITDHPDDPVPRLIYADWLEEYENPRHAAIRAEVLASTILGHNNVHGVLDVERHFGVTFTPDQLMQLGQLPFSKEALEECKDTHLLVAGAPLSVNEVRKRAYGDCYDSDWYRSEPFANDKKVSVRWHLLRKEPVPQSHGKTYDEQAALLTKEELVPFACEAIYMVVLHHLSCGERLLPAAYVRCQDTDSDGYRVVVGGFGSGGFGVNGCWDGLRYGALGLASSVPPRKC